MKKKVIIIRIFLFCCFFLFVNSVNSVNNTELHNTTSVLKLFGWRDKNHIRPAKIKAWRRLFYSLQLFDHYSKFFDIMLVIAIKHYIPCSKRAKNNSMFGGYYFFETAYKEITSFTHSRWKRDKLIVYKTQGCRIKKFLPPVSASGREKQMHKAILNLSRKEAITLIPERSPK